eukprot:1583562-Heterocapsa_arctica.AAC.1
MPSSTLPPVSRFHHLPPRPAPPKPPDPFDRPSGIPFAGEFKGASWNCQSVCCYRCGKKQIDTSAPQQPDLPPRFRWSAGNTWHTG